MGKYSQNYFYVDVTLAICLLNHILHLHPTLCIISNRIYLSLSALSSDTHYQYQNRDQY